MQLNKQFHIQCGSEDVGKYCILPGDPGRCEKIANHLENPKKIAQNREFTTYTGYLLGEKVTVTSTGIGGPSAAIAMEELVALGADTFIRIGTCGGIDHSIVSGDVVIANGAIRQEGTSYEYAPAEYPAVPDFTVTCALAKAAADAGRRYHVGVVQTKDSFYGQHSPHRMPIAWDLKQKWYAYQKLGVLASEMEAAALFTVAATLKVRCGACFYVLWNQEIEDVKALQRKGYDTDIAIQVAVDAIKQLIVADNAVKEQEKLLNETFIRQIDESGR